MPTYMYKCPECGLFASLVRYDKRDDPQECLTCSTEAPRTWEGHAINHTRASFVDGNGRFGDLKTIQKLKKEKANARAKGDLALADKINKETKKVIK